MISEDLELFFNDFSTTATLAGTSVSVIVDYNGFPDLVQETDLVSDFAEIIIKASDVPSNFYNSKIVIGSDTWKIKHRISGDERMWKMLIEKDARPSLWR